VRLLHQQNAWNKSLSLNLIKQYYFAAALPKYLEACGKIWKLVVVEVFKYMLAVFE
jgi:hypothetical protein